MGFDKKYRSERSIRAIALNNDFELFFNYIKSGQLFMDKFSTDILNQIQNYSIENKNDIVNLMNKCK